MTGLFQTDRKTLPIRTALLCGALAIGLLAPGGIAQAQRGRAPAPPVSTPIPEPDMPALIKELGLTESAKPVRDMIKGWHKPKKIVVFPDNNTNRMAWLQEVAPGVKLVAVHSREEAIKELADADAQVGSICTPDLVSAGGPDFHWVHDNHAGMEQCFTADSPDKMKAGGSVIVTNTQRVLGDAVAVHAVSLMMALARGLDLYARMDPSGHFTRVPPERLWEVQDRTLLIAGFGGIGTQMARLGHALGMHVIAMNRSIPATIPDYVEHVGLPGEFDAMLGKADVLMIALPETTDTRNMFNAALFAKMKKGAMLINVARGGEVVTADLVAALKSGQIGAYGTDVTEPFDLPADDPLFTAPNVLITPHMAAQAVDAANGLGGEPTWAVARENLRRYVNGDKLLSVVDPARGY